MKSEHSFVLSLEAQFVQVVISRSTSIMLLGLLVGQSATHVIAPLSYLLIIVPLSTLLMNFVLFFPHLNTSGTWMEFSETVTFTVDDTVF